VGGVTGKGLSGGQKRCLCVAIQLLTMPSVLFLDEPTSGLDSSSSIELLQHLDHVASSNRTVILTIHQPRLEIFHMFHKVVLLCQGKVSWLLDLRDFSSNCLITYVAMVCGRWWRLGILSGSDC